MGRIELVYRLWASKALQVTRAVHDMKIKTQLKSAILTDFLLPIGGGYSSDGDPNILELYLAVSGDSIDRDTFCSHSREAIIAKC